MIEYSPQDFDQIKRRRGFKDHDQVMLFITQLGLQNNRPQPTDDSDTVVRYDV